MQAAESAIDGVGDHDPLGQLAGRLWSVSKGIFRELVEVYVLLWQELRARLATAIRKPQKIWALRDWAKRLRFFNVDKLQPERSGGYFRGPQLSAKYNKAMRPAQRSRAMRGGVLRACHD